MRRLFYPLTALIWLALIGAAWSQTVPGVSGQTATEQSNAVVVPDELTPEMVHELVSKLSDEQVRQLLLERLDAVARQETAQGGEQRPSVIVVVPELATGVFRSVRDSVQRLPEMGAGLVSAFSTFFGQRGLAGGLWFLGAMAIGIGVGLAAYFAVLRSPLSRFRTWPGHEAGLNETLAFLVKRLGVDLLALLALFLCSITVHHLMLTPADEPLSTLIMTNLVVFPLVIAAMGRFLMSPWTPALRVVHTDDWTARYLYWHQIGVALLAGLSMFLIGFSTMHGVRVDQTHLGFWLNLAVFIYLGVIVWRARAGLQMMLIGADADVTRWEARAARAYPYVMLFVLVMLWLLVEVIASQGLMHLLEGGRHYFTFILIGLAPAMDTAIRGLVRHLVPPMRGEGPAAERAYRSTKRSYIRIGRIVVFGLVVVVIAEMWEIDPSNLATAGLGAQLAGRFIEVLIILAIGYLAWELSTLWFNRKLAAEQTALGFDLNADEPGGGEGGGAGGSRLSTVLPMIRLTVQTAIGVMTVLIALSNMGIDVTPLLAGAGIAGIAIGFGAQTLVRDVVSGVFFLIDDAFRVGEYLVIEDTVGTVENLSVRSLQLRHHTGPIHTIPYGEIAKVTNNSRDWVIVKMKFTFPFDTDVNRIRKIFKKIGQEMMEAPYAENLIQPFKSQGVYDVDDVGIVIRGKFMAKPGSQFVIRKDIYARVQKALDEAGIQFARKEVRVQLPGLEPGAALDEPQKQAIAAAAAEAAEKPPEPAAAKPG